MVAGLSFYSVMGWNYLRGEHFYDSLNAYTQY